MKTKSNNRSVSLLAAGALMIAMVPALAQNSSGIVAPTLTLASADDNASGTGGSGADNQQDQAAALAKKLQNPVANLISVPIQNNWDFGIGPAHAMRYTANIQPVIPIS